MGCPRCRRRPVFSLVYVVNTPVLGTMFQFVRRHVELSCTPSAGFGAGVEMRRQSFGGTCYRLKLSLSKSERNRTASGDVNIWCASFCMLVCLSVCLSFCLSYA